MSGNKVVIESTDVDSIDWAKNGRTGTLYLQRALLFKDGETYPDKFSLALGRDRDGRPHPPGEYLLQPVPYVRNERMNLSFELVPQ